MKTTITTKREAWLHALRLRTLPLALASILGGSILASFHGIFRVEIFLLACLTTIFLQILSNLANDYGDSIHGADSEGRQGPIRAVQSGLISLQEMKKGMYLVGALAFLSGLVLIGIALQDWRVISLFIGLELVAIWAAISYTSGPSPYGYAGLGDLSVFLFFGMLGVLGTYFMHGLSFRWEIILIAASLGMFSTSVLNINNIRDIDSDKKAGKRSIPVRVGKAAAIWYNWALVVGGYACLILFCILTEAYSGLVALMGLFLMIPTAQGVSRAIKPADTDPFLKKMVLSTLVWVLLLGIGLLLF